MILLLLRLFFDEAYNTYVHTRLTYALKKCPKLRFLAKSIESPLAMLHKNLNLSPTIPMTNHPVLLYKTQIPSRSYWRWVFYHKGRIQRRHSIYLIDGSCSLSITRMNWSQGYTLRQLLRGWSCREYWLYLSPMWLCWLNLVYPLSMLAVLE